MKTLHELETELDHADMLFNQAADRGDCDQADALTDLMLDLSCEIEALVEPFEIDYFPAP